MLKEFVEAITNLSDRAAALDFVKPEGCREDTVYYTTGGNSQPQKLILDPLPREHAAMDLKTIVKFCKRDDRGEGEALNPAVWYHRTGIVAFLDDADRKDHVKIDLQFSPQLKVLIALEKPCSYSQREFLRVLRIGLNPCVPADLIESVRNLRWKSSGEGGGTIVHGKQSIGKSLETQLENAAAVPEDVILNVPIFDGFITSNTFPVACAIDIDAAQEKFALIPFPGSIENAIRGAEAYIGERLTDMLGSASEPDVPVYYGVP